MAGVAPKACAAWNTIATELVKPTSTATKPAVKADRLKSLKKRSRIADEPPALDLDLGAELDHARCSAAPGSPPPPLALWCIWANSFSRQGAMPLPSVGITTSRDRK